MEAAGIEPVSCEPEGESKSQLTTSPDDLAAVWQRSNGPNGHALAGTDTHEVPASIRYIAERWHLLPPHIRESILTLVDAGTSAVKGGEA